jgi:undecaprenyl-diphosphatase
MPLWIAVLLGVVEGLTEFLPVSSTGHLIVAERLLGGAGEGHASFDIVIQLGAVLAVLIHYRKLLLARAEGVFQKDPKAVRLFYALFIAFLPVAIVGLFVRHAIKEHLFGLVPVAGALIVGGVVMIVVERWLRAQPGRQALDGLDHVSPRRALLIGIAQCAALWPGTSRSMVTIVAGQLTGLSTATAAEFSFLLALPALGAATVFEGFKARHELSAADGGLSLAIGLVVSFFVAWAALASFLAYVKRRGVEPFGYYRIVVGVLILVFLR